VQVGDGSPRVRHRSAKEAREQDGNACFHVFVPEWCRRGSLSLYILTATAEESPTLAKCDTVLVSARGAIYPALYVRPTPQGDRSHEQRFRRTHVGIRTDPQFKGELKPRRHQGRRPHRRATHPSQRVIVGQKAKWSPRFRPRASTSKAAYRATCTPKEHQGQSISDRARQRPRAEREHHRGSKFQMAAHHGAECWEWGPRINQHRHGPLTRRTT